MTYKVRENRKLDDGSYAVIHRETDAGLVLMEDGNNVENKIASILATLDRQLDWFGIGVAIPSGADLDTYVTNGKFYGQNIVSTLNNCPTANNFSLFVFTRTTATAKTQVIIDRLGYLYIRSATGSTFREWVSYATSKDIADIFVTLDNLKPYTDYWWYAPGEGEQDGYEKKAEDGVSVELVTVACNLGEESGYSVGFSYGDSFAFDPATGRYSLAGDVGLVDSNAQDIQTAFAEMPRNKYISINGYTLAYVTDDSSLGRSMEYPFQDQGDYSFVEITYTFVNSTVYTRTPHYRGYISTEDKTTYEGADGYTLLGTVQEQVLDLQDKMRTADSVSPGTNGGYYTPAVSQPNEYTMQIDFVASDEGMPSPNPAFISLPVGADGKTAYAYAQDGGYTGTEEEFATKLAMDLPTDWFESGVKIPSNSDLNDYLVPGKYYVGTASVAATIANSPITNDNFALLVLRRTNESSAGSAINQIIITLNSKIYMRGTNSSGTLRSWQEIVRRSDLADILSEYVTTANLEAEVASQLSTRAQITPEFANDLSECVDTTKLYVLPDNHIYAYFKTTTVNPGGENILPSLTPMNGLTQNETGLYYGYYVSNENNVGPSVDRDGTITGIIPCKAENCPLTLYIKGDDWSGLNHDRLVLIGGDGLSVSGHPISDTENLGKHFDVTELGTNYYKAVIYPQWYEDITWDTPIGVALSFDDTREDQEIVVSYSPIEETITEGYQWVNTGHAFVPTDYEDRIVALEEVVSDNNERVSFLETSVNLLAASDNHTFSYVVEEATRVSSVIQEQKTTGSLTFAVMSDMHVEANTSKSFLMQNLTSCRDAGLGLAELQKNTKIDFVALLGDYSYADNSETVNQVKSDIQYVRQALHQGCAGLPTIWCTGNHDINYGTDSDRRMTEDEMYSYVTSNNQGTIQDPDNIGRNYGYVDFQNQRIRCIYLNTIDALDYPDNTDGTADDAMEITAIQTRWLADIALDLSEKHNPSDWKIILFSHHPLNLFTHVMTVLEAYRDGAGGNVSITTNDVTTDVAYDFASVDRGEIIANIHGHNHNFAAKRISSARYTDEGSNGWLWRICVPNVDCTRNNEAATSSDADWAVAFGEFDEDGAPVYYPKTQNTAQSTSFCVFTIDRKNEKILATAYGAGRDRKMYCRYNIPEGYTVLDYIETSGTQYVDFGFYPDQDTHVSIEMQQIGGQNMYGARESTKGQNFCMRVINGKWQPAYNTTLSTISDIDVDGGWHIFEHNKNVVSIDGVTCKTFTYAEFVAPRTFVVGGINAAAGMYYGNGRYRRFKHYDTDGSLLQDIIACVNPDGEIGMYDQINGVFYGNAGTDELIAGPAL